MDPITALYAEFLRNGDVHALSVALDNDPDAAGTEDRELIAGYWVLQRREIEVFGTQHGFTGPLFEDAMDPASESLRVRLVLTFIREIEARVKDGKRYLDRLPSMVMLEYEFGYVPRGTGKSAHGRKLARLTWNPTRRSIEARVWPPGSDPRRVQGKAAVFTWLASSYAEPSRKHDVTLVDLPSI